MIVVGVIGFGNVGKYIVKELSRLSNVDLKVIASSRGYVVVENRDVYRELVELADRDLKLSNHSKFIESNEYMNVFLENSVEVVFITLPPSYLTGEPNRSIYYELMRSNVSIITSDKTVLALEYSNLMREASVRNLFVGFRATVSAGTPVIDIARALRKRSVEKIRAVLNTTTNYILSLIEKGYSFRDAVEQAIRDKYAEPDPWIDLDGWDPGAKLAIVSSVLGHSVTLRDIDRKPLSTVPEEEVREALRNNYRFKYIAEADFENRRFIVYPVKIPHNNIFSIISPLHNIVEFTLEDERITVEGPAGPAWRTARVMVSELMEYLDSRLKSLA